MKEDVQNIRIEDFDYPLPDERIAKYPVSPRDSSKLLVHQDEKISEEIYRNLPDLLPKNSLLLFNHTRVVQARLKFPKNETTTIEIFCLEPLEMDIQQAMQAQSPLQYKCLVGGARKWKQQFLHLQLHDGSTLTAEKIERTSDAFVIEFTWDSDDHFAEILEKAGKTPLPPYLNRDAEELDKETYQTIFAKQDGSVAAPTAGLHFTENLLDALDKKGIDRQFITLHVGAGTFKPVSSEKVADHDMHYEEFFITKELVEALLQKLDKAIIPVGTTSLRALESMYWLGVKLLSKKTEKNYIVHQWDPYENSDAPSPDRALQALLDEMHSQNENTLTARTQLMIAPGYTHRICSGLLTNFHQPKSTLLLLVSSFVGAHWKTIYDYALAHDFRFLSYGDGCLILKPQVHD